MEQRRRNRESIERISVNTVIVKFNEEITIHCTKTTQN